MADVRDRLQEVFRDVFDDPALTLREEQTAADIDGWDSLRHIDLIVAVEREFGIRFATAEISRTKEPQSNVGSFLAMVQSKVVARG